jgi:spore coat polysaccharide biosynthesis protein SpsF
MNKIIDVIIEARMNSSRLPGKVMLNVNGLPMIKLLIDRLKMSKGIRKIIIATTTNKKDKIIVNWAQKNKIFFFQGKEDDVMHRVWSAAKTHEVKHILNITGDCPLIDPQLISQFISIYNNNNCEYLNNCKIRSYPIGMDIQIYPTSILKKSLLMTKNKKHREHVTLHILKNPNIFKHLNIISPPELFYPKLGLTLDEANDYKLIKKIFLKFYSQKNSFTCLDIINFLNKNPEIKSINSKVKRKKK